jgi:hypothetical protein
LIGLMKTHSFARMLASGPVPFAPRCGARSGRWYGRGTLFSQSGHCSARSAAGKMRFPQNRIKKYLTGQIFPYFL